jgi:hypothetical protein
MTLPQEMFEQACDRLDQAEQTLLFVGAAAFDVDYRLQSEDTTERLRTLLEAIYRARRALSQAAGWVNETIDYLERRGPDDDPCACGECEGEGPALQVA